MQHLKKQRWWNSWNHTRMPSRLVPTLLASIAHVSATEETYPDDNAGSLVRYFAPEEWEPWQCHDQWYSDWCARDSSFFTEGWEFILGDADSGPCAPCRCCKRPATRTEQQNDTVTVTSTTTVTRTTTTTPFQSYDLAIDGVPPGVLVGINGSVSNNVLTIQHLSGWSLFSSFGPGNDVDPMKMQLLQLLGKRMTFTVDLTGVGCACNLALYLIQSPARFDHHFSIGEDRGDQPPYYCDANQVGGQWCPELDIMEANTHAFQATPHKCDQQKPGGEYESCDRGGTCYENTRDHPDAYGPGDDYIIDTTKPFDVSTDFVETFGVFTSFIVTLKQGSRAVVLDHSNCNADYLARMTDAMASGMSLRITYWGNEAETMAWMDSPPCKKQRCTSENAGDAVISNITVKSLPPPMGPAVWTFEDPQDIKKYGDVVPKSLMADHGLFISLDDKGIVMFHKKPLYVKKIRLELPATKEDADHRSKSWFDMAKAVGLDCDQAGCEEAIIFSSVSKHFKAGGAQGSIGIVVCALVAFGSLGLLVALGLRSGCQRTTEVATRDIQVMIGGAEDPSVPPAGSRRLLRTVPSRECLLSEATV